MYNNITNPSNYQLQGFGQNGLRVIDSSFTPVADEYYRAVQAFEDSVVTLESVHGDTFVSKTILANDVLYGLWDSVVVSSGSVAAYIA
jgi:hypothetical protein